MALQPGLGRIADHVAELAERERADLVVVGTHQRHGLDHIWHGSVSHGIMRLAGCTVACVPAARATKTAAPPAPHIRRVLVPTDLSALGNAAVAYGYAVAGTGSVVHLLHVIEPHTLAAPAARAAARESAAAALRALIPAAAAARGIETEVEVVAADRVAETICDTAERLDADLLAFGSHGRSGLTATLAGSVAQRVMADSRRPVLLVRAARG